MGRGPARNRSHPHSEGELSPRALGHAVAHRQTQGDRAAEDAHAADRNDGAFPVPLPALSPVRSRRRMACHSLGQPARRLTQHPRLPVALRGPRGRFPPGSIPPAGQRREQCEVLAYDPPAGSIAVRLHRQPTRLSRSRRSIGPRCHGRFPSAGLFDPEAVVRLVHGALAEMKQVHCTCSRNGLVTGPGV